MDIIDIIRRRYSLPREAYVLYSFLAASSSSINPLLYGIMNPTFGREYRKMFAWVTRILPGTRVESFSQELSCSSKVLTGKTPVSSSIPIATKKLKEVDITKYSSTKNVE